MNLTELEPNLWKEEAIPTEYAAFKILRDNPLSVDTHYLAAPWSVLLNTRKEFFNSNHNLQIENGFTICQHISYAEIIPYLRDRGITTLFTPHALAHHNNITVLPFPHYAVNGIKPTTKNILCSFVGCLSTHQVRKIIWQAKPNRKDMKFIYRSAWHYEGSNRINNQIEYQNILARSRFSLCPRGTGASTIRFWESLQAGAIPVLISDAMRLPKGWDWYQTIVRIAENDAANWPEIVEEIASENEHLMRKSCLAAYNRFSGNNLVSNIRLFFGDDTKDLPTIP